MDYEWTKWEWAQFGMLLVGAPIASWLGATFGLQGRFDGAGLRAATIAGLLGSAAASVVCFVGLWSLEYQGKAEPQTLFHLYESGYQSLQLVWSVASPGVVALVFAIYWRLRFPRGEPESILFSRRATTAIALLSLLCVGLSVGSWYGMRLAAMRGADPKKMARRFWESRRWMIDSAHSLSTYGSEPLSNSNLASVRRFPTFNRLIVNDCSLEKIDLTRLKSARDLNTLVFSHVWKGTSVLGRDLPQLDQVTTLGLHWLSTEAPTLASLAKLPRLTDFEASKTEFQREDLRAFLANAKLEKLWLKELDILGEGRAFDAWPATLKQIEIVENLRRDDIKGIAQATSLTHLHLRGVEVDDELLAHWAALRQLQSLRFAGRGVTEPGFEILTKTMRPQRLILDLYNVGLPSRAADLLGQQDNLHTLAISLGGRTAFGDAQSEALAQSSSLQTLWIDCLDAPKDPFLKLARIPTLKELYVSCAESPDFQFNAERDRLGLERVKVRRPMVVDDILKTDR